VTYQKSLFVDMVYLQQDAFDAVDVCMSTERQQESFQLVQRLLSREYRFADKEQVRDYFTRLTGLFKNLNYAAPDSPEHADFLRQIEELEKQYC
jgi:V/A-type H+-transporting ATPase subunit A